MPVYPLKYVVDFDGVIHAYTTRWTVPEEIHDGPVPGAIEWLKACLSSGVEIALFTARMHAGLPEVRAALTAWFLEHGMTAEEIEQMKFVTGKPHGDLYIDDRSYKFRGRFPVEREARAHRQWNKADALAVFRHDLAEIIATARSHGVSERAIAWAMREEED